jgi:GMP synthase PP-ATPase subunit
VVLFDLYEKIWQFPVAMAPFGVNGGECVILRPVASKEAMTAAPYRLPTTFLQDTVAKLLKVG